MGEKPVGTEYTVILQPEADPEFSGYYNVVVPALPGCLSYGADRGRHCGTSRRRSDCTSKICKLAVSRSPKSASNR